MENSKWITLAAVVVAFVFGVLLVQKIINDNIVKKTQEMQESKVREIAEYRLQCENEKNNIEINYKKQILDLKLQLEKSKILLEKVENEKKYSALIKQDIKKFMNEIDVLFNIKGKQSENK